MLTTHEAKASGLSYSEAAEAIALGRGRGLSAVEAVAKAGKAKATHARKAAEAARKAVASV